MTHSRPSRIRAGLDARVQRQPRGCHTSRPSDGGATDPAFGAFAWWMLPAGIGALLGIWVLVVFVLMGGLQ